MKSLDMPQQVWLQSLISHRIITESHAKALHKAAVAACSQPYRASEYDGFFTQVAQAIGVIGLEIRRTMDESKGTRIVGIVNTKGDDIAQLATTFTPHEITFVKLTIEKIITAPYQAFCIGSKEALDIAAKLTPPITAVKAEGVCDKLVWHGWLRLSRAGRYSLSPRSVMELQSYLQSTYEDHVLLCAVCEEVLTSGSACSTITCPVRVHRHCLLSWERSLKSCEGNEQLCSRCEAVWKTAPVGEAVLASSNASQRQARARVAQRPSGEGSNEGEEGDENEEEEAEEAVEEVVVEEEEEEEEEEAEGAREDEAEGAREDEAEGAREDEAVEQGGGRRRSAGKRSRQQDEEESEDEVRSSRRRRSSRR